MIGNYHLCISGGDSVIFRSEEDYIRGFNILALAVAETDSQLYAESIMSTHVHQCVRTKDIYALASRFWRSYTVYFNNRYGRKGHLGGRPFIVELDGFYHWLTAICYVLRNAVHHGVAPTPFAYRHCSANAFFRKETGKIEPNGLLPRKSFYKHLPKGASCPPGYKMDKSGLILRDSVVEVVDVEHHFSTARSFLFYMNRLSGEEWKREQEKDGCGLPPVTLETIEGRSSFQSLSEMLANEHGRFNFNAMSDIELCTMIDQQVLPSLGWNSVYELTDKDRLLVMQTLVEDFSLPARQVRRCLALA